MNVIPVDVSEDDMLKFPGFQENRKPQAASVTSFKLAYRLLGVNLTVRFPSLRVSRKQLGQGRGFLDHRLQIK